LAMSISRSAETLPRRAGLARGASIPRAWRVAAGVATTAAIVAAIPFVVRSPVFHVRHVAVNGVAHLHEGQVIRRSGITDATNALWVDEAAVERRLEEDPWIANARVRTSFPSSVAISVTERTPVAVARRPSGRLLVAGDGTVLGPALRSDRLPRIVAAPISASSPAGAPLAAPARAGAALAAAGFTGMRTITVAEDGTLAVRLAEGTPVLLGRAVELDRKVRALGSLLAWASSGSLELRAVDVSAASAPAVVLAG
jgi:cell division protein FtsQ